MLRNTVLLASLAVLASQAPASAATLLTFDFNSSGNVVSGTPDQYEVDSNAANLTVSNFISGSNLTSVTFVPDSAARDFKSATNASTAITQGQYWEFTVTAALGYQFDLSSLSFNEMTESHGPTEFEVQVAGVVLGSATTAYTGALTDAGSLFTQSLSNSDLTSAVIRLIAWNDSSNGSNSDWHVDNVVLSGSTEQIDTNPDSSAVPEPASLAVWSIFGLAGVLFARRKRA